MFSTKTLPLFLTAVMLSLALPIANAALLTAYDLVGEDPTGDARNYSAPGVDTGQFSTARTDIASIEMANDGAVVHVKQNIGALPAGTGRYMYVVHFKVEGTSYFTCWNVAWVGGQANPPEAENTFGCSRFTGTAQVGPTTRAAGVHVATADGKNFVRWEVAKTAIKMGSGDLPITDIVGETWFGGAANGSPSTSQSMYIWNQADRAPDAGTFSYSMTPAAPPLALSFSAEPQNATVGPGGQVQILLSPRIIGNGSVDVNWSLEGTPEDWTIGFEPEAMTLESIGNATANLTIVVPSTADNATHNLTIRLAGPDGLNASTNVSVTVDASLAPPPTPSPSPTETTSAPTTTSNATIKEEETGAIPALPAAVAGIAVCLVAVTIARRRHR